MGKKTLKFYGPIVMAIVSLILYCILNFSPSKDLVSYTDFLSRVEKGEISEVILSSRENFIFTDKNNESFESINPRSETFKETLLVKGINVQESEDKPFTETIPLSMFLASVVLFIVFSIKDKRFAPKGIFSQNGFSPENRQNIDITFDDVAGNVEAKENLKDVIDFLKNPHKYRDYGARMPKGIIFYGDPGTGKTLLAKAVAGEANVPFFAVSGSDFVQMYVGVGASRIRSLFKKASSHGKAVIFIDEIDAIGKQRTSGTSGSSEEKDQTLNALLTEMSGFNEKNGIVVIAATNRFDMLDNALLRPGRFDRHIEVMLPDVNARKKILDLYIQNKPFERIDIESWAKKTACFSGAKIENFINEAAILACKSDSPSISHEHLERAYTTIIAGSPKQDRSYISLKDKTITSYHEIGHALASMILLPSEEINKVSIIPSTKGVGGFTHSIPEDKMYYSKIYIKKKIMVLLAGRAAEEIYLGIDGITTGAHNDFEKATSLGLDFVGVYGMGHSLGKLSCTELKRRGISPDSNLISETRELLDELYTEVLSLLKDNIHTLETLTKLLLEKEVLHKDQLYSYLYEYAVSSLKN